MKKLHSIKFKFLQLKIITIFCCLILASIVLIVGITTYKLNSTVENTRKMYIQLDAIHGQMSSFLLELPSKNAFLITGKDSLLEKLKGELKEYHENIEEIKVNTKSDSIEQLMNKMDSTVELYNSVFNDLVVSLRELGNESNGVIGNWMNLYSSVSDSIRLFSEPAFINILEASNIMMNNLGSYNPGKLDEINDKIRAIESIDVGEIRKLIPRLNELVKESDYIKSIETRIGNSDIQQTLKGDLHQSYVTLKAYSELVLPLVKKYSIKRQYYIFILLALFFISFFIFLFNSYNRLSYSIVNPIHSINNFLQNLKKGLFPEEALSIDQNSDLAEAAGKLKDINENLIKKTDFVKELVNKNYTADYDILSKEDKLGIQLQEIQKRLKEIDEEQQRYYEENDIRRYVNEGLAKFSEIMRVHGDNLIKLTDEFIKNLVKYLDAIQGGIFIVDEKDTNLLQLISSFAYDRKKYDTKEIHVGEGLVGTCALEKKSIYLNEIPEDYITITSGLGDAPPDNLLLIPMLQEEQLLGVIEIASLKAFKNFEIDFTQQVANNLASEIISARNNTRTSELLDQSQRQTMEMAEQEEEMRQNMEELQATQEESARRENELAGIVKAIDTSLYVIEYDLEGNIIRTNDRLLKLFHTDSSKVFGKPFSVLISDQKKTLLTKKMIEKAIDGNQVESTIEISIENKKYKFRQILSPVTTKEGLPIKLLHMIVDIS